MYSDDVLDLLNVRVILMIWLISLRNGQLEMADGSLYFLLWFFLTRFLCHDVCADKCIIFLLSLVKLSPGSSEENILFYSSTAKWSCMYVACPNQQDLFMSGGLKYMINFA
jgi:hypothetical protein